MECVGFDLYDERWRDCWVAATSLTRFKKKQVDLNIRQRVGRLLGDHGPGSSKPLTLRIYGTMLKGFCVINNERAKTLFCDCERVILMFVRQPFSEGGDTTLKLPAAKRPRLEATLTLDLDLARVEASEAFDWTRAPLEEGALLRLGAGEAPDEGLLPPSFEFGGIAGVGIGAGPPAFLEGCDLLGGVPGGEAFERGGGWLPHADEPPQAVDFAGPPQLPPDPLMLQLAAANIEAGHAAAPEVPLPGTVPEVGWGPTPGLAAGADERPAADQVPQMPRMATDLMARPSGDDLSVSALLRQRREALLRPGIVYGFDDETMLSAQDYERWQASGNELSMAQYGPKSYAQLMASDEQTEHLGPHLRWLVDLEHAVGIRSGSWAVRHDMPAHPDANAAIPFPVEGGALGAPPPGGAAGVGLAQFPLVEHVAPASEGAPQLDFRPIDAIGTGAAGAMPEETAGLAHAAAAAVSLEGGGAEAQDERTSEVGNIIRSCLRGAGLESAPFEEMVQPGVADAATAACTFAALLALASAGDFSLEQEVPYGPIIISNAG